MPFDPIVGAGERARLVQAPGERRIERVEDQRRLAAARDAGDAGEGAERDRGLDVLEVVLARAGQRQPAAALGLSAQQRHRDLAAPDQILPGQALGRGHDRGRRALRRPPCRRAPRRPGPCRPRGRRRGSPPRRARPRSPCCRGRAGSSAYRAGAGCRAGAGRSRARPARRARRSAPSRSARPSGCAGSRRPRASRIARKRQVARGRRCAGSRGGR